MDNSALRHLFHARLAHTIASGLDPAHIHPIDVLRFDPGEDIISRLSSVAQNRNRLVRVITAWGRISWLDIAVNNRRRECLGNFRLLSMSGTVNPLFFHGLRTSDFDINVSVYANNRNVVSGRTSLSMVVASLTYVVIALEPPICLHEIIDDFGPEMSDDE